MYIIKEKIVLIPGSINLYLGQKNVKIGFSDVIYHFAYLIVKINNFRIHNALFLEYLY